MSDSPHTLIIGVDGGGTGCRAAIGTLKDGILARATGGRANVASEPAVAIRNITKTIETAARQGAIPKDRINGATVHMGLAGVMAFDDAQAVADAFPHFNATVTDDRSTALNGAFGGEDGFLLSVGTGTIAATRKSGIFRSVGGWGFHLGDQASGSWLGQEALRRVLLCQDGILRHSGLTHKLLAKFKGDPNEIVAFSMSAKPGDYGTFAPDVMKRADAGDPIATDIIRIGAAHLGNCLNALHFSPGDRLCLTGGVGPHYAKYLPNAVTAGLMERRGNALDGAFAFAMAHFQQSRTCLT